MNMDKKKILLLNYLTKNCSNGYKVLDVDKIMHAIKKYKNNFDLFSKDIEYLCQRKYIDLKYLDKNNICLTILDNSRIFQENIKIEKDMKSRYTWILLLCSIISCVASFAGAFLANLLFG